MKPPLQAELEIRIARLERTTRWARLAVVALTAAGITLAVSMGQSERGAGGGHVVEAERFVLRDATGAIRARLSADSQGRASLAILDKREKSRVALGVSADGAPVLVFGDADGRTTRLEMSIKPDGTTAIGLGDSTGKFRATMEVKGDGSSHVFLVDEKGLARTDIALLPDGSPLLAFSDPEGRIRARLSADGSTGTPGLILMDDAGKPRASLGMSPDKTWGVTLVDTERNNRARLSLSPDGSPSLSLSDRQGRTRASLNVFADAANLLMYDKAGKSRAQLGVWPDGLPALNLFDPQGETLWSSP